MVLKLRSLSRASRGASLRGQTWLWWQSQMVTLWCRPEESRRSTPARWSCWGEGLNPGTLRCVNLLVQMRLSFLPLAVSCWLFQTHCDQNDHDGVSPHKLHLNRTAACKTGRAHSNIVLSWKHHKNLKSPAASSFRVSLVFVIYECEPGCTTSKPLKWHISFVNSSCPGKQTDKGNIWNSIFKLRTKNPVFLKELSGWTVEQISF